VRIVGFDVGERRIGVAISDASATLARPVGRLCPGDLLGDGPRLAAAEITRLASEEDGESDSLSGIVVGLPRYLDGSPNRMTARVTAFAEELGRLTGLPVTLQDERLTSHEAESLLATTEKNWRVRKKRLDEVAASIILQDYLDARLRRSVTPVSDPGM
jgi:putative Holliday junction resolvase